LEDVVVLRGFQKDIGKEMSDKNLMVIPSLKEPFGRIFCESAEAKLPVLVSDTGGLGELSQRFNLGIRFKGNDPTSLALKIEEVVSNYPKLKMDFEVTAAQMLNSLKMTSYITIIEQIISTAIEGNKSCTSWLGDQNQ
jgi:glycosyltransferase involved in cell wall biosynthesis